MKRPSSYVLVATLAALVFVQAGMAQPRERARGMGGRMSEELNLSEEQKTQIRQIMLDTRKKNIDTEAKQKLAHLELEELLRADNPDQKKIDAQISEVSKLRETMMRARIESRLAIQKLLTPEQRKKAQELRPFDRGFGFGEGHGGGFGMGMHRREFRFEEEVPERPEEL